MAESLYKIQKAECIELFKSLGFEPSPYGQFFMTHEYTDPENILRTVRVSYCFHLLRTRELSVEVCVHLLPLRYGKKSRLELQRNTVTYRSKADYSRYLANLFQQVERNMKGVFGFERTA